MIKILLAKAELIKQYREEARAICHDEISKEIEIKRGEGLYPFEGKWRTLEEITNLQKLMRKKDRTIFIDLIILFIIIMCAYVFGSVFLFSFLY